MAIQYPTIPGVRFKAAVGFPGYCVGDNGSVWTQWVRKRLGHGKGYTSFISDCWRERHPCPDTDGYPILGLYKDGKRHTCAVHKLVLTAFRGPRPKGLVACHNNGIRDDNRLGNLRWDTPASNYRDRDIHGNTARGEKSGNAKLTNESVLEMRRLKQAGFTVSELSRKFGIDGSHVTRIIQKKSWTHVKETG